MIEVSRRKAVFSELKDYCMHSGDHDFIEVTEWSGSWKGGTVGCSYDKLPHESIEQCLRRMEKEREFR